MTSFLTDNGVVRKPSRYSVTETLDRLEAILREKGVMVFARIDQRATAEAVGLALRPTQLLIFGDPKAGTPLMDACPSLAIDLPLKALAWEGDDGQVWFAHNSPAYLQQRHGLPLPPFTAVETLLDRALE